MIRNRSLVVFLLGVWLGASILIDIAVTQNFQAVDRFLAAPGDAPTAARIESVGPAQQRVILRRNAAEENNWIFMNWERSELLIGCVLLVLLASQERSEKLALAGVALTLVFVAAEHFLLTPRITSLGRIVDGLTPADPRYKTFWMLHGFYSGLDILKMLTIFGLGAHQVFARVSSSPVAREAFING